MTIESEIEFHKVAANGLSLHYVAKGQEQAHYPLCWYFNSYNAILLKDSL